MKRPRKECLACILSLAALALLLAFFTVLLTPKQHDHGAGWGQFRQEAEQSIDVLVVGSSMAYCDVVPAVFWEETGLTAYVMGGQELPFPMEEVYLREALRTQRPRAVLFEVTSAFWEPRTGHEKLNIGQMPWGWNRWKATFTQAGPEERLGLLFPLYFYHDRWDSLTGDDWSVALRGYEADPLAGYTYLGEYRVYEAVTRRDKAIDPAEVEANWQRARALADLCAGEGILPVFYLSPAVERTDPAVTGPFLDRLRTLPNAYVLDCGEAASGLSLSLTRDFYDALHLNAGGAETFTRWLAGWCRDTLPLSASEEGDVPLWEDRAAHFHRLRQTPLTLAEDYFTEPLRWADEAGITDGGGAEALFPASPCSLGQALLFLWRSAGSPPVSGDPASPALAWAEEQGLLTGPGDPDAALDRGDLVGMLWRMAGSPAAAIENPYADLDPASPEYAAALWAYDRGLVRGSGEEALAFQGADPCTRGQVVTFLWRYYHDDGEGAG